jgi:hypothetical protein
MNTFKPGLAVAAAVIVDIAAVIRAPAPMAVMVAVIGVASVIAEHGAERQAAG